ncbi:MAG: hypothetical protein U0M06_14460 [Clostridia bacterium]|nr:hypothetical protein [Clostridia bacterium]
MEGYKYEINVEHNVAVLVEDPTRATHVCQNKGEKILFIFDGGIWYDRYDGDIKALFIWNGKYEVVGTTRVSDAEYECYIPAIYGATSFYVGAFIGEDYETAPYNSTTRVEIPCALSVRDYAKTPQPSYGRGWADIAVEAANKAQEYSALAKEYADLAKEYADQATSGGGGDINFDVLDARYMKAPNSIGSLIVPTINASGAQATMRITESPTAWAIPTYGSSERLSTKEPTADLHCANKKYVDEHSGWELITAVSHVTSTFEAFVDENRVIIFVLNDRSLERTAMVGPRSSSAPIYSTSFAIDGNLAYIRYADGWCEIVTPDGVSLDELTIHVYAL